MIAADLARANERVATVERRNVRWLKHLVVSFVRLTCVAGAAPRRDRVCSKRFRPS
jgi:hypothetical protein